MKRTQRRPITLIEIIVVMFFIATITGVIGYNIHGALEQQKAFTTVESMRQVRNILGMQLASGGVSEDQVTNGEWKAILKHDPLIKSPKKFAKDGWGKDFEVTIDDEGNVRVESTRFNEYQANNPSSLFRDDSQNE